MHGIGLVHAIKMATRQRARNNRLSGCHDSRKPPDMEHYSKILESLTAVYVALNFVSLYGVNFSTLRYAFLVREETRSRLVFSPPVLKSLGMPMTLSSLPGEISAKLRFPLIGRTGSESSWLPTELKISDGHVENSHPQIPHTTLPQFATTEYLLE